MRSILSKLLYGLLYAAPVALLTLAACGGGGSSSGTPPITTFTVSGAVLGFSGTGLILENASVASGVATIVPVNAQSGVFGFVLPPVVKDGQYNITVDDTNTIPPQKCFVLAGASSSVMSADVTDALVTCVDDALLQPPQTIKIEGYVLNLQHDGLKLKNNGVDEISVPISESIGRFNYFSFPTEVTTKNSYAVTQSQAPGPQSCTQYSGGTFPGISATGVAESGVLVILQCNP